MPRSGQSGATRTHCQPLLLLGSHCDEASVGTITPSLRSNRRMTISISFHTASRLASLIWSRNGRISGKGILSVLHRCGERREPLGACYDFDGHLTEAGSGIYLHSWSRLRGKL